MRINLKRFTIGAILLATLSLLLQGCGSHSESPAKFSDQKPISGTVSSTATNLPLSGASVVAYPIVNGVPDFSSPLSSPVTSDSSGSYALNIPVTYTGSVLIVATPAATVANPTPTAIRSVIPGTVVQQAQIRPVMVNYATEMSVLFIATNLGGSYTSDNIRTTLIQLETLFGTNFETTQLPSSATDASTTKAQQDLLVTITAIQSVIAQNPATTLTSFVASLGTTGLGTTIAAQLNADIGTAISNLIQAGTLPSSYTSNPTITAAITALGSAPIQVVSPVSLSDITPPTAPSNLSATAVSNPVLTWAASTDDTAVTGYLVYRATASGSFTLLDTVGGAIVTYTDSLASQATTYSYKVIAFDAARNMSADSNIVTVTTPTTTVPVDTSTYSLSGKVTYNGTGIQGVVITIIGTGYGTAITAADGSYSFPTVINGGYSISAALPGYIFSPSSLSVTVQGKNISNLDFISNLPGTVDGGVTYPDGTITGGITYPAGTVIGGVTYPTGVTVVSGVAYPTGTVVGGVTYPNGVVIGGVTYPPGTVVGGAALPPSTVTGTVTYPSGMVSGAVTYPNGTVLGGVTYPTGTVVGNITYSTGTISTLLTAPVGTISSSLTFSDVITVSGRVSHTVGGVVVGLEGVTVNVTGSGTGSTTTGPLGYFVINVVSGGTYTLTPVLSGYTFTALAPITPSANLVVPDFTATP